MVSLATGGELMFGVAVVSKSMDIIRLAVTVMLAVFDVTLPEDAVALLVIEPASMSAWVIVCVEVQFVDPPDARGPVPHVCGPRGVSGKWRGPTSIVLPLLGRSLVAV